MTKTLTALAAAAAIGLATFAAPSTADARCIGCAVGAGIIGGIAAGAIIAGATRPAYPSGYYSGYAPVGGYDPYYEYAAPYPVACPGGYWARRPVVDQWGNFRGYSRPRFFCP